VEDQHDLVRPGTGVRGSRRTSRAQGLGVPSTGSCSESTSPASRGCNAAWNDADALTFGTELAEAWDVSEQLAGYRVPVAVVASKANHGDGSAWRHPNFVRVFSADVKTSP
jgi:hypothetical protein